MNGSIQFPNLGIHLGHVGNSIHIFGFEITYYGILICVGMLTGIWFVILEAKRQNQDQDKCLKMILCTLLGGILGARLYYVVFSWNLYQGSWMEILRFHSGGFALYGGILGGALTARLFCRIQKLPFAQMADIVCMGLLVGQIIGRWGDFFNRDSFGEYTDGPLAMLLPLADVNISQITGQMLNNQRIVDGEVCIQVQPVFLYEIIWNLALLLIILGIRRKKKFHGEISLIYLCGYGLGRCWMEIVRTDQLLIPGTQVGVSWVLSVIAVVACGAILISKEVRIRRQAKIQTSIGEVENAEFTEESNGDTSGEDRGEEESAGQQSGEPQGHSQDPEIK